jgi:hypothetical protein
MQSGTIFEMPTGRNPAERLALKLRTRAIETLEASTDFLTSRASRALIPIGHSFIYVGNVSKSADGGYDFDISERTRIGKSVSPRVEWSATVCVTPEREVYVDDRGWDPPFDLIKQALEIR